MIRTVIVDDEEGSRTSLRTLLTKYTSEIQVVGEAEDVEDGIKLIDSVKPDLLFLDIRLRRGRTTFDILRQIQHQNFTLIFTTAFDEYAVKAFRFNAIDYLLKPINLEELLDAISKARQYLNTKKLDTKTKVNGMLSFNQNDPTITLATENSLEFIKVKNIIRLEAQGSYTTFILSDDREVIVSKNLKNYDELLKEYGFFRNHQSHMVNMQYVVRLLKEDGGIIEMSNGSQVPISRRKKDQFLLLKNR